MLLSPEAQKFPARQKSEGGDICLPNTLVWWEGLASPHSLASPGSAGTNLFLLALHTPFFLGFIHGFIKGSIYQQPFTPLLRHGGAESSSHSEEPCSHAHTGQGKGRSVLAFCANSQSPSHTHPCLPFKNLYFSFFFLHNSNEHDCEHSWKGVKYWSHC